MHYTVWGFTGQGRAKKAYHSWAADNNATLQEIECEESENTFMRRFSLSPRHCRVRGIGGKLLFVASLLTISITAVPHAQATGQNARNRFVTASQIDLSDPVKKELAMQVVSSAENSTLHWRAQYAYIEDIHDGRGYTAGIIGFCSGTGDMRQVVRYYTKLKPNSILAKYLPALDRVNGSESHAGLDPHFTADWKAAARDPLFQQAQNWIRDRVYFTPAVQQGKADGLRALGQFLYYDALVMHGPGEDDNGFNSIRKAAMQKAKTPTQGGKEANYLNAFLDARTAAMRTEAAHEDTSRVDTAQRVFVQQGNFDFSLPLAWKVYGTPFKVTAVSVPK